MDVVTISHGIIAVMDLVEKMKQVEIVFIESSFLGQNDCGKVSIRHRTPLPEEALRHIRDAQSSDSIRSKNIVCSRRLGFADMSSRVELLTSH